MGIQYLDTDDCLLNSATSLSEDTLLLRWEAMLVAVLTERDALDEMIVNMPSTEAKIDTNVCLLGEC